MTTNIDCFFIGHNEMQFSAYEHTLRSMGMHSGAYRELSLNFIWYRNEPFSAADAFNRFYRGGASGGDFEPLSITETFSAAVAYLGSYLNRRGYTFDYVNSFQDEKEYLKRKLMEGNILTIAIITTLYVSVFPILEIVDFIRKFNRTVKIIIGGPFIHSKVDSQDTSAIDYLFSSVLNADFYVNSSQGEAALVKIIHSLKNDLPFEQINNICFRGDNGYVWTPGVEENNNLTDNLVNWELFSRRVGKHVAVRTAISCPFSCAFCRYPSLSGKYQTVPVADIETEFDLLSRLKGVHTVNFIDDTFNVPQQRFREILRMMIKNKYGFRWHSYFRCQFADREMIELMKESGCEGVFLGLESGNNGILKNMNKAVDVEHYLKAIALLKEYEIVVHGNLLVGFPGETIETVQDGIRLIDESEVDFFRVQPWFCIHDTPIWNQREQYRLKGESFEWSHETMDSKTACDLVEQVFLSDVKSTWVPQYNFDFYILFHLLHRGISWKKIKRFLGAFNEGVREKLLDPSKKEASDKIIGMIKESLL